jgi:hypothetical protein
MGGVVAPALARIPHLYHFTNINNLSGIRRLGGIFSTARLNEMGELFYAGGDEASLALDRQCGMDQFVHLCFTAGHPMAFRVRERNPNVNLTYLRIDRTILGQTGVMFATGVGMIGRTGTIRWPKKKDTPPRCARF